MKSLKESILESINENYIKDTKEVKGFIKTLKRLGCEVMRDESAGIWKIYPKKAKWYDDGLNVAPSTSLCVQQDYFWPWAGADEGLLYINANEDEDEDSISLDEFDKSDNEHLFYTDKNANLIAQILIKNL